LEARLGKNFVRPHLKQYNGGMMVHAYHPSYEGNVNRRIAIQAFPGINVRPYLKNKRAGEVAQVVEGLLNKCEAEFKPQYCQKEKEKKMKERKKERTFSKPKEHSYCPGRGRRLFC
jgi:hypothetical protein